MGHKYSIDFGTTNSVVARWNHGKPETVELAGLTACLGGNFLVPSLVYVQDGRAGQVLIGAAVRAGAFDRQPGNRLFRNFKRSLGSSSRAETRIIDGVPWDETRAAEHFLRCLLGALPCQAQEIEQLVITVPVATFDGYGAWLKSSLAGFPPERTRIVDESTAAALGYAVTEPGAIVLISDFGGGTLDLSLVRLPAQSPQGEAGPGPGSTLDRLTRGERGATAQVIAKAGESLGGADIDQWLLQDCLERSQLSGQTLGLGYAATLSACESAKIALSTADSVEIVLRPEHASTHTLTQTRHGLETLLAQHGFYASLERALDKLMGLAHQRGVFREDIGQVLLVGGSSLIPSVQRSFDTYFRAVTHGRRKISLPAWPAQHWKVENTTIRVDRPFTAVVEGALQISAGLNLDDRLTHSYGLRVAASGTGLPQYEELIPAGSPYPSAPVTVKLAAARPGQTAVDLIIAQINVGEPASSPPGSEAGRADLSAQPALTTPADFRYQAELEIRIPLEPPGVVGKARLSATLYVDGSRHLRLSVTDLLTHRKLVRDGRPVPATPGGEDTRAGHQAAGTNPELPALATHGPGERPRLSLRSLAAALKLVPPDELPIEVLSAGLGSDDTLVRFTSADLLCRRADRESRLALEQVLVRGTPPQRASVVQHLYRLTWFSARPLFEQSLRDDDSRVREAGLFGLCKMHAPEAYRLAAATLRQPDTTDGLRRAAVWGTASHPDPGAVPVLEQALAAHNLEIREEALEALGASGAAAAIPIARRALDDPHERIKYSATLSWVELAGEGAFTGLAGLLATTRGEARRAILRGFFHATNYLGLEVGASPHADLLISALQTALSDELAPTRAAAALSLAWIRHPRAGEVLREAFLREPDRDTRAHMLSDAVNLSSPVAAELLAAASIDPDQLIRQTGEYLRSSVSSS